MASLKIDQTIVGDQVNFEITGTIDEDAAFPETDLSTIKELNIDFNKVTAINSCGIREWIRWISSVSPNAEISYSNCPKVIVDQINMVDGFLPVSGKTTSFYVPYFCEACESVTTKLHNDVKSLDGGKEIPGEIKCQKCGETAEIDVIESKYFKFLKK